MNSPEITPDLAARLGADPGSVKFLRYSQNHVYEFTDLSGVARILRITLESHRSRLQIEDELAWVLHLRKAGLNVCEPVPGADGKLIRAGQDGPIAFNAVVFRKAEGRPVTKEDLSPDLFRLHGRQLGRLHALAAKSPHQWLSQRKRWDEERYFTTDISAYVPEDVREPLLHHFAHLQKRVTSTSPTRESDGPVHFDLGYSNFFIHGEELEVFDFDNCARGPFIGDIAAALYSSIFIGLRCEFPGDRSPFESPKSGENLEKVWLPFCDGYRSENAWPETWNDQLAPWFEIMFMRSVVHAFRLRHPLTDPAQKRLLDADVRNILARNLPVNFDFSKGRAIS